LWEWLNSKRRYHRVWVGFLFTAFFSKVPSFITNIQERDGTFFFLLVMRTQKKWWIETVINKKSQYRKQKCSGNNPACIILIPYTQWLSEKFKIIGNGFDIKSFRNKKFHLLRKIKLKNELRDNHSVYIILYYIILYYIIYVYIISYTCGTEYSGETIRSLGVRIKEHTYNIMQGYFERPNWLHIEYHQIDWNQTDVLMLEPNTIYRKYKDATYMLCMDNPISQSSVATSIKSMWLPTLKKELKTAWIMREDTD